MRMLSDFFFGKLPLWKAFVIFGLGANFAITFISGVVLDLSGGSYFVAQSMMAIIVPLSIFTLIGQWRCAINTSKPWIGYLFRFWLCVAVISAVGNLLPTLPDPLRAAISAIIVLAFLAAIGYCIYIPIRNYIAVKRL